MSNKLSLLVNFVGVDKMTGLMKGIVGLGRDGSKSIKALSGEAKKLDAQMSSVGNQIAKGSGNVTQLVDRKRELAASLSSVNAQLERQKRLGAINADRAAMRRRGEDLSGRGQGNMMSGTAMATPLILASKAAMDFSSGMVDIQQKAELSNAETDRMSTTILRLARSAHQLPEDMRMGVDTLAGLGLDPRKAVAMIGPIGRLGTAFKVELADGANAAFANLNNLKVPIGDTARALYIMAASGNAGAFEVKDMARWFPSLTAQMQALGQKGTPAVADLAAALQIARRGAGTADEAANNIQNLLAKIQSPETVKKFAKFGIDLPNALKKAAREGKTPLETIADLTQKATRGDTAKMGNLFEDMQAQSALRALILNMSDFRKMREDIARGGGTVDRAFGQREARDASIKWRDFMGSVQALGITMGNSFLPAATQFLTTATGIITVVGGWAQANPQAAATLTTLLGGMIAARIALGGLQFAFGSLLGPIASTIAFFRRAMVLGQLGSVAQAAIPLLAGVSLPILAIGAAVGALAYLLYAHWGPISGFVSQTWGRISGFMATHWTRIRNILLGGLVIFAPFVAGMVLAGSLIYRNWDRISGAVSTAWLAIGQGVSGILSAVAGMAAPFIAPFISIGTTLAGMVGQFFSFGANIVSGLVSGIVSMSGSVIQAILHLAENVGAQFAAQLGIKSPSRLFMAMGGHITDGLSIGIDQGGGGPARSAARMAAGVAAAGAVSLASAQAQPARLSALTPIQPAATAASPAMAASPMAGGITIQVYGAQGQSVDDLAEAVLRKFERLQARNQRSNYSSGGR